MTYGGNYEGLHCYYCRHNRFLCLNKKTPKWYSYSYSEFSQKKEKTFMEIMLWVTMSQALQECIIDSIKDI